MVRLTFGAVLATALLGSVALAETQAEIAARENEEGKSLMFDGKYPDASAKFQNAVARVPEAKYFFNLCTSRFQEGRFGEALTACNSADDRSENGHLETGCTQNAPAEIALREAQRCGANRRDR